MNQVEDAGVANRVAYFEGGLPRFETIHSRVLLGAGGEDNETPGENLWDNSIDLAEQMLHVRGHPQRLHLVAGLLQDRELRIRVLQRTLDTP